MPSKVQNNLISHALRSGRVTLACHLALLASTEGGAAANLDNAYSLVRDHITPAQWAGHLSALQRAGKYQPSQDPEYAGHWGYPR